MISKKLPANLRKSKKREAKLVGIFYYMDPDFIKIKYVCYADNSLIGITELKKKSKHVIFFLEYNLQPKIRQDDMVCITSTKVQFLGIYVKTITVLKCQHPSSQVFEKRGYVKG
jgi:hypothetical protein